jgi:TatD DNase family protein
MVAVSVDVEDARAAQAIAEAEPDVWCTAGVHPSEAGRPHDIEALRALIEHPKCLAWGEMGLDGHWPDPTLAQQRLLFEAQLELVARTDASGGPKLPVIVHSRKAVDAVLAMIDAAGLEGERFVFHCFTEGPDVVSRVLATGASVSFTGVVTYRNAAEVAAASDLVPLDRLMVETDSPYLTPEPHRGAWPNHPANVVHVSHFLAARRGMDPVDFESATDATARRFFNMPQPSTA